MTSPTLRCGLLTAIFAWAALALPAATPAATCSGADEMPGPDNAAILRSATLCLINDERTQRGLRPLLTSKNLQKAAQRHSAAMVRQQFFDHVSPGGSTLISRIRRQTRYLSGARGYSLGENIAWGSGSYATPRETVSGWMESPDHRANILNRRYRHIGIGIAIGAPEDAQGMPAATYTTDFGTRRSR